MVWSYKDRTIDKKLEFYSMPEPNTGCRIWLGGLAGGGRYGKIRIGKKNVLAHRASYECHVGPIPKGFTLDHLCRLTLCIEEHHLEPVTQKVNNYRGNTWSGVNHRKTHCPQNHPLSGDNLYVQLTGKRKGKRLCRICMARHCHNWYVKQKAA